ncbi:adenylyltransferase/cytidyltransferase family protein [Crocinitomix catalasitica]|nr:adenylyltransferase/cytidyltransferase family protein [Crocinitomix catalasitica]
MSPLKNLQNKIKSLESLKNALGEIRGEKQIAFTNGCFDILHKGHVEYLSQSADRADILILGLNSDDSVRRQEKGNDRPINDFEARSTVLAALSFIDFIVEFDDDTPIALIRELKPDILLKGADYDPDETDPENPQYIVGSDIVRKYGGKVEVIPLVEGYSTTDIINKLK